MSVEKPGRAAGRVRVAAAELPSLSALLTLAVGVVVIAGLVLAREVLVPVTLAVLLSFLLAPLMQFLRRVMPRVPAVLLSVVVALGVIAAAGAVIADQIARLVPEMGGYESTIAGKIDRLENSTLGGLQHTLANIGKTSAPAKPTQAGTAARAPTGTAANPLTVSVAAPSQSMLDLGKRILEPVVGPLGTAAIVLITAVFILLQQDDLRDRLIRLFGSADLHRTTLAMNDAARRLSKYFLTQLAINAGFGVIVAGGLLVIGVPSPLLWGMMATLLRFIPYLGAPLAGALPALLGAAIAPGWTTALEVVGLFAVSEFLLGQVVEPLAYGHSTGLSPVSIVIAALFWTWIWGPIGLLLSTPLTLCLVVLGRHVERLEFLDVLLGDRPALTPVESLYQRLLADDPDEAASQAELLLKERPLSAYYDEVALRALRLAALDVARGVLTRERQIEMRDAVTELVEELDDHEDQTPDDDEADDGAVAPPIAERAVPRTPAPPRIAEGQLPAGWAGDGAALCLGGRLPLDDALAAILAQLLRKHGVSARMASHELAARGATQWTTDGTSIVFISYLEATGSPAHLRALVRRLRARLPNTRLVLLLAASDVAPEPERDVRRTPGLDGIVETFREAITTCLDAIKAEAPAVLETETVR